MNTIRHLMSILLALLVLMLVYIYLTDNYKVQSEEIGTIVFPTYKSDYSDLMIYTQEGILDHRLIAQHVEYFSEKGIVWFTKPTMTSFNKEREMTWLIKSDRAKLTSDRILYLYGHIEVRALTNNPEIRKITANNAKINLITKDVILEDLVKLYGTRFNSSSLKMRGNLRSKNAELIEKVRTFYEIKNK